jgi:alkylated DNA repair dioxygenase AlkB
LNDPVKACRHITLKSISVEMESRISGLTYIRDFLGEEEQVDILRQINELPWSDTAGIKRRVQHYGYEYGYQGHQDSLATAPPIPDFLGELRRRLEEVICGGDGDVVGDADGGDASGGEGRRSFNQVIINEYKPGEGIAPHVDNVRLFGDTVVSVSLGSGAVMTFNPVGAPKEKQEVYLHPGSAVILTGDARYRWQHSIPARKNDTVDGVKVARGTRISVTFRRTSI